MIVTAISNTARGLSDFLNSLRRDDQFLDVLNALPVCSESCGFASLQHLHHQARL